MEKPQKMEEACKLHESRRKRYIPHFPCGCGWLEGRVSPLHMCNYLEFYVHSYSYFETPENMSNSKKYDINDI